MTAQTAPSPDRVLLSLDRARRRLRSETLRAHPARRRDYEEEDRALLVLLPAVEAQAMQWSETPPPGRPEWQRLAAYGLACLTVALVALVLARHLAYLALATLPAVSRGLGG